MRQSGSDHRLVKKCPRREHDFAVCDTHYPYRGRALSSVVLSAVRQDDHWRGKIAWPNYTPRYFGRFDSQAEAERWIVDHQWLTEQRQEPDADDPDTTNDRSTIVRTSTSLASR